MTDTRAYSRDMLQFFEKEFQETALSIFGQAHPVLAAMQKYHLGWEGQSRGAKAQGKRIRPLFLLLTSRAVGGDWRKSLPAAAAVELIHNFSLIHDDIQDGSELRHGRKTVWVKWGNAQAINAGDAMFACAHLALQRLSADFDPSIILQAYKLLDSTCLKLTNGQYLDMSFEDRISVTLDEYWAMIGGKTCALLSCATQLGALLGGASTEQQAALGKFGVLVGEAFQVWDDWLGIWGNAVETGKSIESDLVTGKKTLPVCLGLQHSTKFAERWEKGKIEPVEVAEISQILAEDGIREETYQTSLARTNEAIQLLRATVGGSEPGQALQDLTLALVDRKS